MSQYVSTLIDEEQSGTNSDDFTPEIATWLDFEAYDTSIPVLSYRNEKALRYLYDTLGWAQRRIGERYGVTQATISRWMQKHSISTRGNGISVSQHTSNNTEHQQIEDKTKGERDTCLLHRFQAIGKFGLDAVDGNEVHHRLNSPVAVNLIGNLVPLDSQDHNTEHQAINQMDPDELADRADTVLDEILDDDGYVINGDGV